MFQSLRPNNQIFILHKDKSLLEVGSVVSVSMPTPKYPVPQVFGQPQEMVVDIVVKVNNQDITYQKLPANLEIADFGTNGIVISDNFSQPKNAPSPIFVNVLGRLIAENVAALLYSS